MRHGTYIGEDKELQGETALIRTSQYPGWYQVQFNNLEKFSRHGNDYAFNWHQFRQSDFKVDEEVTW